LTTGITYIEEYIKKGLGDIKLTLGGLGDKVSVAMAHFDVHELVE